ncbi:diphthamide biosynthesis enzyme Dph2 [Candidatus Micrarchaeota archaeon]|nr:diphthamide biosynthesis enzyme Dph2 [Candidatus Micrarchaeota archaeon]
MRILLQFPEGLKQKAAQYARQYEKEGHEVFLSASACYGACDLALDEAGWLKADKIIHFGHNRFMKGDLPIPVEYVEYKLDMDVEGLSAVLPHLGGGKTIALATTVQHVHQLEGMKQFLENHGKRVLIGKGERAQVPGQILGCDGGAVKSVEKDADAIVFVGDGMFHPLALATEKPVFAYNPSARTVKRLDTEIAALRKRRKGAITRAYMCKRFAILLSTKPGQFNMAGAQWAKKELDKRGFEAMIVAANEIEPMALKNFMTFECLINTACPRMSDDTEEFGKPMLNLDLLQELLEIIDGAREGGKKKGV